MQDYRIDTYCRVCGDYATSTAVAPVWFTGPGMSQDLTTEINLPLKSKSVHIIRGKVVAKLIAKGMRSHLLAGGVKFP